MPQAARSPLDDTDRLVVDGNNLLGRMGGPGAPPTALVSRLRAVVPPSIAIELVFDGVGHGVTGRVAQSMHVRYAGRRTADEAILELVGDARQPGAGAVAAAGTLVVTDDRDLRTAVATRGARTAGTAWLLGRMGVVPTPGRAGRRPSSIGAGRPPSGAPSPHSGDTPDGADRPGWRPGRGATSKTGPAHKVARHRRHPGHR